MVRREAVVKGLAWFGKEIVGAGIAGREPVRGGRGDHTSMMRLSREKIVRLSHQIIEVLVSSDEVEFIDDRDTIRQQIVQILTAMLKDEEKIELEVRKRITSQKKEILEGSEEWDVLHRKYYQEELRRLGIAAAPDDRHRT
jgi:uncharacterized protein